MSKKPNRSTDLIGNYIQMQKLNCILKIRFNNDKLTASAKEMKTLQTNEIKRDIRICC